MSDEKIIDYLNDNQEDFVQLLQARQANCGKYFVRQPGGKYDDNFLISSPEAKDFFEKHKNMIVSSFTADGTLHEDYGHKKAEYFHRTGEHIKHIDYSREEGIKACQTFAHIIFSLNDTNQYIKLSGIFLEGPHSSSKRIEYINSHYSNFDFVQDWQFFQEDPDLYNGYFDDTLNEDENTQAGERLQGGMIHRASNISSDEYIINCKNFTHGGFIQIKPKWFITTSDAMRHSQCGSDWFYLFFSPIFNLLFN